MRGLPLCCGIRGLGEAGPSILLVIATQNFPREPHAFWVSTAFPRLILQPSAVRYDRDYLSGPYLDEIRVLEEETEEKN